MKRKIRVTFGFTLIELLVVVGVLGIIAAGLLATIDPLEQFRKTRDLNRMTIAGSLLNGVARYAAAQGNVPWRVTGATCFGITNAPSAFTPSQAAGTPVNTWTCVTDMINSGELKASFSNVKEVQDLYISTDSQAAPSIIRVCFHPESKSIKGKFSESKYYRGGQIGCETGANPDQNPCAWCAE